MSEHAEVVVIGGGVVGSATTYYLAEQGLDVVLVERDGLASGTSGACQGAVLAHIFGPPLLAYVLESQKLYQQLREQGIDYENDKTGTYLCFDREEQRTAVEQHVKMQKSHGLAVSLLEQEELKEIDPSIGENVLGASFYPEDCLTNPFKVAHELAFAARELGARVQVFSEVKDIEMQGSDIRAVITDHGKIRTSCIVNAAGVWSPTIAQMVGYHLPVKPQRGQILVTEPVKRATIRYILDADYLTTAYDPETVKASNDPRIRLGVASSLAQSKSGNWTIGSSRDFAEYDRSNTRDTLEWLVKRAITFLPKLGLLNCIRSYAGLRPITDDKMPVLGKIEGINEMIVATALHGEGITLAALWGKLSTELVMGKSPSMPIDIFDPARF